MFWSPGVHYTKQLHVISSNNIAYPLPWTFFSDSSGNENFSSNIFSFYWNNWLGETELIESNEEEYSCFPIVNKYAYFLFGSRIDSMPQYVTLCVDWYIFWWYEFWRFCSILCMRYKVVVSSSTAACTWFG